MANAQLEWDQEELLAGHDVAEPLVAGGVRCHGGFDSDGAYISPRTLNRAPAIAAWQAQRGEQFHTPLLDIELSAWPESYPNVAQAKFLISAGVPEPVISSLTRIGTVEGFGAAIRHSTIPDFGACLVEDTRGTAMAHLGRGLFEAHARDEAGFDDEGGHKQMWFAARDVAFENPVTEDQTQFMLQRMGLATPPGTPEPDPAEARRQMEARRLVPDVDADLEFLIARMAGLLLIEISAFHTFSWAEQVLSDTDLVAGEGEAARLVSYIRSDETPHVEYLKTVLSELADRTFVDTDGAHRPGRDVVGPLWDRARSESLGIRRLATMKLSLSEVARALEPHRAGADLLEEFHSLGSIRPGPDGDWVSVAPIPNPDGHEG